MSSFNKVILLGNLTRDPENRTLPSGSQVSNFGIGVNRKFKSLQGDLKDETCFVDIEMFGKLAEISSNYLHKGDLVLVEGRLRQDTWEKDGQRRSKLKVVGSGLQLMPKNMSRGSSPESADTADNSYSDAVESKEEIPF